MARLRHQLLGLGDVVRPFWPTDAVFDVVVDPVAVDHAHPVAFGLVYPVAVDGERDRLAHALVVERTFRVCEAWEFEPPIPRNHRRERQSRGVLDARYQ